MAQGRLDEAALSFNLALKTNPALAEAHINLGNIQFAKKNLAAAAIAYRQALALDAGLAQAHYNLGNVHGAQGDLGAAIACYREALRIDPRHGDAYTNLGNALVGRGQRSEAIECFQQALALNPHNPDAHNNLGNALNEMGQPSLAIKSFQQALALNPGHADAHNNLGLALAQEGRLEEAADCYRQALSVQPGHRMALGNQALLNLLRGDFATAWKDYEQRLGRPGLTAPRFAQPRWDGRPLHGKTILIYAEQGLGDTIQFLRYLPMVQGRGGKVLFQTQAALQPLLVGLTGLDYLIIEGTPLPAFDVWLPLLSLPGIFGTTLATIPATVPYLRADAKLVERWREDLDRCLGVQPAEGLRVGIAWQGNPAFSGDRSRSIPLTYFARLARVAGVRLISLQKEAGSEQIKALGGHCPILDLSSRLETFSDTAAVMMNLDLVISSCTSVPHLAGALGIPVWTALQQTPDWRWLLDRLDSPWYPTMRLFRQCRAGDWEEVFERIAAALHLEQPRRLATNPRV